MCDCYSHKCEYCDAEVSLHIADFCVQRATVHVVCPECLKHEPREASYQRVGAVVPPGEVVFVDRVTDAHEIMRPTKDKTPTHEPIGVPGDVVLIFCEDAGAYGIHLN